MLKNTDSPDPHMTAKNTHIQSPDDIRNLIYMIRGQKVMLDSDLARLYGVETRVLNQAVKRNIERFPEDFMFQLNKDEEENLKSQFVTSNWGGKRTLSYAFTEQGVAMLSSVLKSKRAIEVNIAIMRAFVQLRQLGSQYEELARLVEKIDKRSIRNSQDIALVIKALKEIMSPKVPTGKRRIGF